MQDAIYYNWDNMRKDCLDIIRYLTLSKIIPDVIIWRNDESHMPAMMLREYYDCKICHASEYYHEYPEKVCVQFNSTNDSKTPLPNVTNVAFWETTDCENPCEWSANYYFGDKQSLYAPWQFYWMK